MLAGRLGQIADNSQAIVRKTVDGDRDDTAPWRSRERGSGELTPGTLGEAFSSPVHHGGPRMSTLSGRRNGLAGGEQRPASSRPRRPHDPRPYADSGARSLHA